MASILIVEDETQVLIMAESYLAEHGHHTHSASSIAEAMAIVETDDIAIDILFTDLGLMQDGPQAGLELAKQAVERRSDLRVLYTTGQTVTDGMKALFVANSALLEKPYTVEDLNAQIRALERLSAIR
jgi:DNA-binding NtrC family response regulator